MKKIDLPVKIFLIITSLFAFIIIVGILGQKEPASLEYLDPSDPLLLQAKQKAAKTLDIFILEQKKFPEKSFVRFQYTNNKNETEHIWGRVKFVEGDVLQLTDINKGNERPYLQYPEFYQITTEQIEDWLIETGNDSVRGGFTTQVILLRKLYDQPQHRDTLLKQLGLFLDPLED